MKKLLWLGLAIAVLFAFLCPLMALAEPDGDAGEAVAEPPPKETYWNWMGYETVDEYMEWFVEYTWHDLSKDEPFWKVRYADSKEDFMEWFDIDEEEYQILEDAWQRARKKALEEEKQRLIEVLVGFGGTPGITNIMYNGKFIKFGDAVPEIIGGSTFVPAKAFFEVLGADVGYDAQTRVITVEFEGWSVDFVAGRDTMGFVDKDGAKRELPIDVGPYIKNDALFIPIRAVAEGLGFDIFWDKSVGAAIIFDPEKIIEEIDKGFTVANSLLEMSFGQQHADGATYKTVLEMLVSITQFDSLDGDTDSNVEANITVISDGSDFYLTGAIDVAELYDIIYDEILYYAYDDDELEMLEGLPDKLKNITVDLIINHDEGVLYVRVPILSEFVPEYPKDAWIAVSGIDEYFGYFTLDSFLEEMGIKNADGGTSVGAIIYSDAFPYYYYFDNAEDDVYYDLYSYFIKPLYKYDELISIAEAAQTLIGDEKFVKSGDDYTLVITTEEFLAVRDISEQFEYATEFDLEATIKTKDGAITGIAGRFVYRAGSYYGDSVTRYTCELDIGPDEVRISLEIHEKNSQKVLIGINSKTAETNEKIPAAPPEGDKIIPYEELLGIDEDFYPDLVVPLMSFI